MRAAAEEVEQQEEEEEVAEKHRFDFSVSQSHWSAGKEKRDTDLDTHT